LIIIFLSDISWNSLHQRPHHIAAALAERWEVLWVQPATLSEKFDFHPLSVAPNIHTLTVPALPYNARQRFVQLLAKFLSYVSPLRTFLSSLQSVLVRRALKVLDGDIRGVGFFIQNFQLINLVHKFHPLFVHYDYIDNVFGFTRLPKHAENEWMQTIRRADSITVTSPSLAKQVQPYRTESILCVSNGVEYSLFAETKDVPRPLDLPQGKPIIGYVGAVYPWLDYDLLKYVSGEMKELDFAFVGTIHPRVRSQVEKMTRLANVHFLGFRPYQSIPQYLHYIRVAIIPFQKTDLTATVNPVKLYEYSAAGKPTVATDFSEDLLRFNERIFIARSNHEFVSCLRNAIEKSQDETYVNGLRMFARSHDWGTKTSMIIQLIQKHLSEQQTL
jgi:glycosyltransferase involved in cell wall biosynthesis